MAKDIAIILSHGKTNGIFRVTDGLIREWKKQGHHVSVINANGKLMEDSFGKISREEMEKEPKFKPFAIVRRFFLLKKFFRYHKEATIVALSISAITFASFFGLTVKNKVVLSERNDPAQYPESKFGRKLRDFCFRLADVCVFQTEDAGKYFSKSIQKKGVVIPNPINDQIPYFDVKEREKVIMSAGRLKPQKNYPLLIRAFAKFSASFPDYYLDIYGEGYLLEELVALADELGVKEKVRFKGFCSDIFPIMAKVGMFVMSSDYEGISNSMLEAIAIGTPTICTDCPVGGARQMIEDQVNGMLVPLGDVDALAAAMCKVAGDKEFAEMLGNNGKKIREKYPIEVIAEKWIGVM